MIRRLPLFLLIDCSESMAGEKISQMESGISSIIQSLRTDPYALETVYVSIIAFAGVAKVIVPLVELPAFYPPKLPLGSGTHIGGSLTCLMSEMETSLKKTTAEQKGDWRPIVFLFTDGQPTEDASVAIRLWQEKYKSKITLVAVGLGQNVDYSFLSRITNDVFYLPEFSTDKFQKFLKWVTESVKMRSKSVGEGKKSEALPIFDESVMRTIKNEQGNFVDDTSAAFVGRCQRTKKPYLIKYEREISHLRTVDFSLEIPRYNLTGCHVLEESYFEWSGENDVANKINTQYLFGAPSCPHCANQVAFAACACGKLMCINSSGEAKCPWCQKLVIFHSDESGSDEGFDVQRGQG